MRIQSKEFHYYDIFNSHDKKDPIVFKRDEQWKSVSDDEKLIFFWGKNLRDEEGYYCEELGYVGIFSFCGQPFITSSFPKGLDSKYEQGRYSSKKCFIIDPSYLEKTLKDKLSCRSKHLLIHSFIKGNDYRILEYAHRKFNSPLLQFYFHGGVIINELPLNMEDVIGAGEAFQRIETFIGNTLTDREVVRKKTDKESILSHGFDLKHSFRGR
jgi:hypothetical protein